jgi:outer membrane protein TolC
VDVQAVPSNLHAASGSRRCSRYFPYREILRRVKSTDADASRAVEDHLPMLQAIHGFPTRLLTALAVAASISSAPLSARADDDAPALLTLTDALRAAADRSQASVAAGLDLAAAREGTTRAKAPYWPTVSVSGGWNARDHEVVAVFDTPFGVLAAETTQKNFFVADISATQLIWDGGRRSSALKASQSSEAAVEARGRAETVAAQLDALSSYLRVLVLKAQRRVVDQRVTSLQDHLREAKDLYEQGIVARNDLLGTEVRLRNVKDQLSLIDNGEAVAKAALNRLMGRDPGEKVRLPESLPAPPSLPESPSDLRKRLPERSPVLRALRARQEAERRTADLRRGEDLPTLFARATHDYQQNQYLSYPNSNALFVGLNWSLFDGGARHAGRRQADLTVERTQAEIDDARRGLEIELERTGRDYEQALREAGTARSNTAAAEENLRIVEDQYRAGLARTTDVLDAEAILAESRFAALNQHYTAYLREGALLGAAGVDLVSFFSGTAATSATSATPPKE